MYNDNSMFLHLYLNVFTQFRFVRIGSKLFQSLTPYTQMVIERIVVLNRGIVNWFMPRVAYGVFFLVKKNKLLDGNTL